MSLSHKAANQRNEGVCASRYPGNCAHWLRSPQPCRHCHRIWIGVGYQWGFWLLLTTLTTFSLAYINPEKPRPSMDNGTKAASGTLQRRKTFSLRGQH